MARLASGKAAVKRRTYRLRAVTYNIHRCCGLDRRIRPARIGRVLREIGPDIVGLQEVVMHTSGEPEADQARYLADELGFEYAVGATRVYRGADYGNVVLSRYPIKSVRSYDLSVPKNEPRGCLRVDISIAAVPLLHIFNVHLGTAYLERRKQARILTAEDVLSGEEIRGPRVVLGDFNEWTRGLTTRLMAGELESADIRKMLRRRRTYPGIFPFLHLDHIYYERCIRLERLTLHRSITALVASDHLPLVADLLVPVHTPSD
jgi:endonuclease/exonuclease/phosphatase family metal-dependent hydrolase